MKSTAPCPGFEPQSPIPFPMTTVTKAKEPSLPHYLPIAGRWCGILLSFYQEILYIYRYGFFISIFMIRKCFLIHWKKKENIENQIYSAY